MRRVYCLIIFTVVSIAIGACIYAQQSANTWPPSNVVKEPESGQWVLVNELVILSSGQDIPLLIEQFRGKITLSVTETNSYQVRFPVSNLDELNMIRRALEKKGVKAVYAIVRRPPRHSEPQ